MLVLKANNFCWPFRPTFPEQLLPVPMPPRTPAPAGLLAHDARLGADDLTPPARAAWEASGLTQSQAAERLGVSRVTFAHAIGEPSRSLTSLRVRIVEAFTDFRVEGPEYRLVEKGAAAPDGGAGGTGA